MAIAMAGCKAPRAFGDRNSLIVHSDSALWAQIGDRFLEAIERRHYTSRPERIFQVTHVSPDDTLWRDLRQWNQVVVLGTADDPRVDDLADRVRGPLDPPRIFQVRDVWANGQTVSVLALPAGRPAEAAVEMLPELYALLEEQYREWVIQRMYASGVNDSLVSALTAFGFAVRFPRVYDYARQDSLFRFKSAYPDQASLLRSVLVTWRTGRDAPGPDDLRAWRREIGQTLYDPHQHILEEGQRFETVTVDGQTATELRGVWEDESDFPAAGPFIARAVPCPDQDRTYYMDAWVYAPGRDKYLYVLQLEYLLDTFRCSREAPVPITRKDGTFEVRMSKFEVRTRPDRRRMPDARGIASFTSDFGLRTSNFELAFR